MSKNESALLTSAIVKRIQDDGPISFCDFMEMALYYPEWGYYSSERNKIGREGDYYTSCNVSELYGAMLGRQLEEMWAHLSKGRFTIVEFGAGSGTLCHDILNYLKNNAELYANLEYCIIEKSMAMRAKAQQLLTEKVTWHDSINEIPAICGCVISNELVDNFAVHQVIMDDCLQEIYVDYDNGFKEIRKAAAPKLVEYFRELNIVLPKGYRTEVNLEATTWITAIGKAIKSGYVITVDYGYLSGELYDTCRREGTIMCYNNHRVNEWPYMDIGIQDITAHVNFTALSHWGKRGGLATCGYTNQAHFLLALGLKEQLVRSILSGGGDTYSKYRQNSFIMQQLLSEMGMRFKVLIQQKGAPQLPLTGLRLSPQNNDLLNLPYRGSSGNRNRHPEIVTAPKRAI